MKEAAAKAVMTTTLIRSLPLRLAITVVVEKDGDSYHAFCPALRGLHVDGETEEEALDHAKDAIEVYLVSVARHGDAVSAGPEVGKPIRLPKGAAVHTIETRWPVLQ